jgi:hypothetical protein
MGVTEYLQHARNSADLADRAQGEEKERIMAIAHEWLKLAGLEASDLARLREVNGPKIQLSTPPKIG